MSDVIIFSLKTDEKSFSLHHLRISSSPNSCFLSRVLCRLTGFPIAALPVERALRRGVLHPEAEAVRALALSGGELAALGLEGPAIGAAQRRLAAHILSHPEDNTPARLLALARAELSGP